MVHLILTGATGLVGSSVLSHILSLSTTPITRLTILSRNPSIPLLTSPPPPGTPSANNTTQIEVIHHKDFGNFPPELLDRLRGAEACIWALGVSQNDVDKDTYVQVTQDFPLAAARAFAPLRRPSGDEPVTENDMADSAAFKFVYVSAEGATLAPRPWTSQFGRVKFATEAALLALSKEPAYRAQLAVYSARPAAVDGSNEPWIWKESMKRKGLAYRASAPVLLPAFSVAWKAMHSPTEKLGGLLVELALGDGKPLSGIGVEGEGRTIANVGLRRMAGI